MNTRFGTTTIATAAFIASCLVSTGTFAAPPSESELTNAQHTFAQVEARYRAGIVTNDEWERAKATLTIAQAEARLQQARSAYEQQKAQLAAGILSSDALAESHLSLAASEVSVLLAKANQQRQVMEQQKVRVRAGIGAVQEAKTATEAFQAAQTVLTKAQSLLKAETISVAKARLLTQQARYKAGIGSQAEVDHAQAEYTAALK